MPLYKFISIVFVFLGAVIMAVSIVRYHSTIQMVQSFLDKSAESGTRWYRVHHYLMVFFLISYIVVLISIINDIHIVNEMFTSVIFFVGAGFVLIGILLQSRMLSSIKYRNDELIKNNKRLQQVEDATIYALAFLAETRDEETGKHIERTAEYVGLLAQDLSKMSKYNNHLTDKYIHDIVKAAPLHDIGKVGISDEVLKKTGKLNAEEFEAMKLHCQCGANILTIAESKLDFESYFTLAIPLVMSHHERWDGEGYPLKLKGDNIPLSAQIMAVADVYDALRSERCYKKSFSHEKSKSIINNEREKQFAPDVVDSFLRIEHHFEAISNTVCD